MDNKDILILILVIFLIYLFICNNSNKNFSNKTFKNLDSFTNDNDMTIEQSIKNMGDLTQIIQENSVNINGNIVDVKDSGVLPFTNNILFNKDVVGCSLYSIILWPKDTPPYPNTNPITVNDHELSYNLSNTDCWYPCIGGTIIIDGVIINIPDMKGRMMVGFGATNNHPSELHQFLDDPGTHVGGEVPLRSHNHDINNITGGIHRHRIQVAHGNQDGAHCGNKCQDIMYPVLFNGGRTNTNNFNQLKLTESGNHNHNLTLNNTGSEYNYTKTTIPHSVILQYWMRIR